MKIRDPTFLHVHLVTEAEKLLLTARIYLWLIILVVQNNIVQLVL